MGSSFGMGLLGSLTGIFEIILPFNEYKLQSSKKLCSKASIQQPIKSMVESSDSSDYLVVVVGSG